MSVSIIDQSTGNPTQVSGNANDKVGNLSALSTTDKSSAVGAINEVNNKFTFKLLGWNVNALTPDDYNYFDLNENFNNYLMLLITWGNYSNVFQSILVSSEYFNNTGSGRRPMFYDNGANGYIEVWKNTNTSITVKVIKTYSSNEHINIYGFIKK